MCVPRGFNDIYRSLDIRANHLDGIIESDLDTFESRRMDHNVNAVTGPRKPPTIPNVADKKPHTRIIQLLGHLRLTMLAAGVNADSSIITPFKQPLRKRSPETSRPTRYEN
jgi:hypothetical protein